MGDELKVTQKFIDKYRFDGRVLEIIRNELPRIRGEAASVIFEKVFAGEKINIKEIELNHNHVVYRHIKKKIDDQGVLSPDSYLILKQNLTTLLKEVEQGFLTPERLREVDVVDGKERAVYMITKNFDKYELEEFLCDESGLVDFKYDFANADLPVMPVDINKESLQRAIIEISSFPMSFDFPLMFAYRCSDNIDALPNEYRCVSPEIIFRKSYVTTNKERTIKCPGMKCKISDDGKITSRRCTNTLSPIDNRSKTTSFYSMSISFVDSTGVLQSMNAFSFKQLMPGRYESVLFKYGIQFKVPSFNILDVKEMEKNPFVPPIPIENENYVFTLQKAVDDFIRQRAGIKIWGLFPIKACMLLQKMASVFNYALRFGIDITGSKSCGKSLLLKYYGLVLYNYKFKTTVGLSISIPALRGTVQKVSVLGKEFMMNKKGMLGLYENIHIDEIGENPQLIQQLKSFLSEDTFSNDKAYGDSVIHKRTAHVNLSKNVDRSHIGLYTGAIKKYYDNLEVVTSINRPDWDVNWDLFQPLENYQNPYLKIAIEHQRQKLLNEQKFWVDGSDVALHDRFPFFFFLTDDNNENLGETVRENKRLEIPIDAIDVAQRLVTDDLNNFFLSLMNQKVEFDMETFLEVDKIVKDYHLDVDSRIKGVYYDIIKLSVILNKRIKASKQDYDLLRYIIEKTNRQITLTETNSYELKGPTPEQMDALKLGEKHFGVMIESEKDVFSDFSSKG